MTIKSEEKDERGTLTSISSFIQNKQRTGRAAHYLNLANAAWRRAEQASSYETRQSWVSLAKSWEALARLARRAQRH